MDLAVSATLDIEDHAALLAYLRATGRIGPDETPRRETLAGGVSNRTVLVERGAEAWVLKQALPKLRVAVDWFSDPARVHREALGLRWLERFAPPGTVTPLVFEDEAHHLLAMRAVPRPHDNLKALLLAGALGDAELADYTGQWARLLAAVHRAGHERRGEVETVFADRRFFESLRLEPYYLYTAAHVPPAVPFLRALVESTRARRLTLVHGDYSPKNVLVHRGKLVLLDHEVIHFGDPAFDLGFSLTHLLSKARHVRGRRAGLIGAARAYWRRYRDELGHVAWADGLSEQAARHTLGCLLARVAGRSPLEYLSADERQAQQAAALALMAAPPATVEELIERYAERL